MPQAVVAGAANADAGVADEGLHSEGQPVTDGAVEVEGAGVPAGDVDVDDDADDDDYSDVPFKDDPRFKAMAKKLAKQRRQLTRMRPVYGRAKDLNLDDLILGHRSAQQLQDALSRNPKLAKQVAEAVAGFHEEPASEVDDFDPSKLPFDTNDESGKFFANLVKEVRGLQKELKAAKSELSTLRQHGQQQDRRGTLQTWRSQVVAASAKVPEWARDMFNDAVYGAFHVAEQKGTRLDPQKVIQHYLSKLPISDKAKQSAAAAARADKHNSNLPRVPQTPGVPASARKPGETVADVNRRIRGGGYFPR